MKVYLDGIDIAEHIKAANETARKYGIKAVCINSNSDTITATLDVPVKERVVFAADHHTPKQFSNHCKDTLDCPLSPLSAYKEDDEIKVKFVGVS